VDLVQECRLFVYHQYRQEVIQSAPAAPDSAERLNSRCPPLLSNNSSSDIGYVNGYRNSNGNNNGNGNETGNGNGHSNATQPTTSQEDIPDLFDFDPSEFQRIFGDDGMLDFEYFASNHVDPKQARCYCTGPCLCPNKSSRNGLWDR
jgi:hypothetical protein